MRPELSLRSGQVVARSLRITSTTHVLVAAIAAGITLNAMVAIEFTGLAGQITLLATAFATVLLGSLSVAKDVLSRSSETLSNLRSIGASMGGVSVSIASALVIYGAVGAAVGVLLGAGVGALLGSAASIGSASIDAFSVIASASAGTATGFYLGARTAWRS